MDIETGVAARIGNEGTGSAPASRNRPRRIESLVMPKDGEDGLFHQSWYPICLSSEVTRGRAASFPFLDGRVAVYRGQDNIARVVSGYCPHFGADLGNGHVVDNNIQCPWHKFEFDGAGFCRKTGTGDAPPPTARLFAFPTKEQYGLIWAFNGEEPLFDLPFPAATADIIWRTSAFVDFETEPWLANAAVIDFSHFQTLHNFAFNAPMPWDTMQWDRFSCKFTMDAVRDGVRVVQHTELWGTTLMMSTGTFDGRWFGFFGASGLPSPGRSKVFVIHAAERRGDEEEALNFLAEAEAFNVEIGSEDLPISRSLRFRVGTLTKSDAPLHKYFAEYLKDYPRAHPAAGLLS